MTYVILLEFGHAKCQLSSPCKGSLFKTKWLTIITYFFKESQCLIVILHGATWFQNFYFEKIVPKHIFLSKILHMKKSYMAHNIAWTYCHCWNKWHTNDNKMTRHFVGINDISFPYYKWHVNEGCKMPIFSIDKSLANDMSFPTENDISMTI